LSRAIDIGTNATCIHALILFITIFYVYTTQYLVSIGYAICKVYATEDVLGQTAFPAGLVVGPLTHTFCVTSKGASRRRSVKLNPSCGTRLRPLTVTHCQLKPWAVWATI